MTVFGLQSIVYQNSTVFGVSQKTSLIFRKSTLWIFPAVRSDAVIGLCVFRGILGLLISKEFLIVLEVLEDFFYTASHFLQ